MVLEGTIRKIGGAISATACADGLRARAGDLAKPQLGLSQGVYELLCAELDTIVHNGALVNHAYSYEQLFEPNVLGSVEVRTFFLSHPRFALDNFSSTGSPLAKA